MGDGWHPGSVGSGGRGGRILRPFVRDFIAMFTVGKEKTMMC